MTKLDLGPSAPYKRFSFFLCFLHLAVMSPQGALFLEAEAVFLCCGNSSHCGPPPQHFMGAPLLGSVSFQQVQMDRERLGRR